MNKKKVALVLGGSGGIGSEIVRLMSDNDINVCSVDLNQQHQNILKNKKVSFYKTDLTSQTSIDDSLNEIIKNHKTIDMVVFSASAPIKNKPFFKMEWNDFDEHINIQIKSLFHVIQNLKNQIKNKHKIKFIIILTEYCIGNPPSGTSHYITAKYSLMGFAKCMATELTKYNCTVNMVSPGMVETNLLSNLPPKLVEITAERNPLKRLAKPIDVANVVLFLSKDESNYLNGVNICVNGGGVIL